MAKELPYFKFEPSEYIAKDIQDCSLEAQGAFINICSFYWIRMGKMTYATALRRVCGGKESLLEELESACAIKVTDEKIEITFLDRQLEEFESISEQNRKNAQEGWKKRKAKSNRNANALKSQSQIDAIREEKRREENIKKEEKDFVDIPTHRKISIVPRFQIDNTSQETQPTQEDQKPYLHPMLEEVCEKFDLQIENSAFHTPVRRVNEFLKKIDEQGSIDYFRKQLEYYFKLKKIKPSQSIAGWMGWFGANPGSDAIWNAQDYEAIYLHESSRMSHDKSHGSKPVESTARNR